MKYPRNTRLPLLVFVSLLIMTLLFWAGYKKPSIGIDDANIYMVYMKNFAEGHGLVWNVGGERVEGFTSLLWTLFGAAMYKISASHLTTLLLVSCFVLTFLTLYQVTLFARRLNGTEHKKIAFSDVIILALLLIPRGFVEWNVLSLMETPLWMLLIVTITLQICNFYLLGRKINIGLYSLIIILMTLTRPESIALNFFFVLMLFIVLYFERGLAQSIRRTLVPALAYGASVGGLLAWRLSYFGWPFPNTYYAKVSGDKKDNIVAGIKYLLKFFYFYPQAAFLAAMLLFFGAAILLRKRRNPAMELNVPEKVQLVLCATVVSGLLLPVLTGGDHFMFSRFYQPLLPLLYLSAVNFALWQPYTGLSMQAQRRGRVALLGAFVFATIFFAKLTPFDFVMTDSGLVFVEFNVAKDGRAVAEQFNKTFADCKQYPSIGVIATGGVAYSYRGKTVDLLGLNNTVMAHANTVKEGQRNHASFDKKGFWQLRPDIVGMTFGGDIMQDTTAFVLYENQPGFRPDNFIYRCMKKIQDDEDFRQQYIPGILKHHGDDYYVFGYYAKPFLDQLDPSKYQFTELHRRFNPNSPTTKR